MSIERDPFSNEEVNREAGSIGVSTTLDFISITGSPIRGDTGVINLAPRNLAHHLVLSTGTTGRVSARTLTAADIPNMGIANILGLQAALDAKVPTARFLHTVAPLVGGGNLSADRTISLQVGTLTGTVAAGNDSRFPANIAGIRKARTGLVDIAAIAKTDYWDTSDFVASGSEHAKGLVPDPGASAGVTKFLREDSSWAVPAGGGGGTATIANTTLVIKGDNAGNGVAATLKTDYWDNSLFVASGASQARGLVPAPGASAGTTAFLREDATWVDIMTMVASGGSHAGGLVPDPGASAGTTAFLREDATWQDITDFGPSGVGHKSGLVPDPGAGAGITRYLREDGGWATPAGGGGGATIALTTSVLKGDGLGNGIIAVAKTDFWDTSNFVASGASHAKGLVPDPGVTGGTTKFLREDATWAIPPGGGGAGTVTSVALTIPTGFSLTGSPVTTAGTIAITEDGQLANTVKAGPLSGIGLGAVSYRSLVVADLPTGQTVTTVPLGNDNRFSSSVTGLRKGSGVGSNDVAAVAKTDYWDVSIFTGSGPGHLKGLVPDPGSVVGVTRFLREDATWQPSTYTTTLSGDVTGSGGASIVTSIATSAILSTHISTSAITTGKIADQSVTTVKIGDLAVTAAKIANATIIGSKIATDTITSANLASNSVGTSEIIDLAVTSAKIAVGAVVPTKLGYETITVSGNDIDWSLGNMFYKSMVGTTTFTFSNSAVSGKTISVLVTGAFLLSFPAVVQWTGGTMPVRVGSQNIYTFQNLAGSIFGSVNENLT